MSPGLPRNTGKGKRPGGGMWLSTMQSSESRDAGKPGTKVSARRNT